MTFTTIVLLMGGGALLLLLGGILWELFVPARLSKSARSRIHRMASMRQLVREMDQKIASAP